MTVASPAATLPSDLIEELLADTLRREGWPKYTDHPADCVGQHAKLGSSKFRVHSFEGVGFRGFAYAVARTRARRNAKSARPYIVRLMTLRRLTYPSSGPVLHGSLSAARTASKS